MHLSISKQHKIIVPKNTFRLRKRVIATTLLLPNIILKLWTYLVRYRYSYFFLSAMSLIKILQDMHIVLLTLLPQQHISFFVYFFVFLSHINCSFLYNLKLLLFELIEKDIFELLLSYYDNNSNSSISVCTSQTSSFIFKKLIVQLNWTLLGNLFKSKFILFTQTILKMIYIVHIIIYIF